MFEVRGAFREFSREMCARNPAQIERRFIFFFPPMLVTGLIGWRRGVVASVVRRMNEVTIRRARLVLGWVTVFGRVYHHGMYPAN